MCSSDLSNQPCNLTYNQVGNFTEHPWGLPPSGISEHVHGLKGGDVAGRAGVPDGVSPVVELVLGEEDGEFDLAGPGPAVLALALASGGLGGPHADPGAGAD